MARNFLPSALLVIVSWSVVVVCVDSVQIQKDVLGGNPQAEVIHSGGASLDGPDGLVDLGGLQPTLLAQNKEIEEIGNDVEYDFKSEDKDSDDATEIPSPDVSDPQLETSSPIINSRNRQRTKGPRVLTTRPIIGVLSQALTDSLRSSLPAEVAANATSYISASYVKWLEAAGARVVPVLTGRDDHYYERVFNATNGLLLPGGAVSIYDSPYASAGQKLFSLSVSARDSTGDVYPIWGTCLGFELLVRLAALNNNNDDDSAHLRACNANNQARPLDVSDGFVSPSRPRLDRLRRRKQPLWSRSAEWRSSALGKATPADVLRTLTTTEATANFHNWCLTPQNFSRFGMNKFWRPLATSTTADFALLPGKVKGNLKRSHIKKMHLKDESCDNSTDSSDSSSLEMRFVSLLEARRYPIWASQFHPEKNAFEWTEIYTAGIPHDAKSVRAQAFFAEFFVAQARRSGHAFPGGRDEEEEFLIFNYTPYYAGKKSVDFTMQQIYLFP